MDLLLAGICGGADRACRVEVVHAASSFAWLCVRCLPLASLELQSAHIMPQRHPVWAVARPQVLHSQHYYTCAASSRKNALAHNSKHQRPTQLPLRVRHTIQSQRGPRHAPSSPWMTRHEPTTAWASLLAQAGRTADHAWTGVAAPWCWDPGSGQGAGQMSCERARGISVVFSGSDVLLIL